MTTTTTRHFHVTTKHPTGWMDGTRLFTTSRDGEFGWYAKAGGFGCSRTYRSELDAIRALTMDNACTITKIEPVQGQPE